MSFISFCFVYVCTHTAAGWWFFCLYMHCMYCIQTHICVCIHTIFSSDYLLYNNIIGIIFFWSFFHYLNLFSYTKITNLLFFSVKAFTSFIFHLIEEKNTQFSFSPENSIVVFLYFVGWRNVATIFTYTTDTHNFFYMYIYITKIIHTYNVMLQTHHNDVINGIFFFLKKHKIVK